MKENNINCSTTVNPCLNGRRRSTVQKKAALSLSTLLIINLLSPAVLDKLKTVREKAEKEDKSAAISIDMESSLADKKTGELFSGKSIRERGNWNVDPHLEKLVDRQIKIWQMSVSEKTGKGPVDTIGNWLSKVSAYRDYIAGAADKYSININFLTALLAWESRGNPRAESKKAARGFGQFMKATASEKGLIVDDFIDERLDPCKSINAAASYIGDAARRHRKYSFLLTAYYNYGPGNVRKNIKKFGLNESLFYKLPKETKMHYINVFAIKKLLDNPEDYGFSYVVRPSFKKIFKNSRPYIIKRGESLSMIAKKNNLNIKTILLNNPKILNPKRVRHGTVITI